ncbi:putative transposase [Shigella flexneri 2747-71]|nr:putative transposase [Shigella flexneri 2747-71]
MVLESQGEYDSQWATICSIAPKDWLYAGDSACLGSPA